MRPSKTKNMIKYGHINKSKRRLDYGERENG